MNGEKWMNVLIFGATGMVGQSVLRECLLDKRIVKVLSVGRTSTGVRHEKLNEVLTSNLLDLSNLEEQLKNYDACFFCLGVSSAGMSENKYKSITYDITISVAETLSKLNPNIPFIYVSGSGTDSTEKGRRMWARVKGKTENDLLKMPNLNAFMFRPGGILPLNGVKSKTKIYQAAYMILKPAYPIIKKMFPNSIITSEEIGRAMINIAIEGDNKRILESIDIKNRSEKS